MAENDTTIENAPRLTRKQETLITSLLTPGLSLVAAAKCAGISERTARRWLKEPAFQSAYQDAQRMLFDDALRELRLNVGDAIKTLRRHLNGEDTRPYVQVAAASKWLDLALELYKTADLERKVSELEQAIKAGRD